MKKKKLRLEVIKLLKNDRDTMSLTQKNSSTRIYLRGKIDSNIAILKLFKKEEDEVLYSNDQ